MAGDFDLVSKSWWITDKRDYSKAVLGVLDQQFTEYDKDLLSNVTAAQRVFIATDSTCWGNGAFAGTIAVQDGSGMNRVHGILSKRVGVSTSNEEFRQLDLGHASFAPRFAGSD